MWYYTIASYVQYNYDMATFIWLHHLIGIAIVRLKYVGVDAAYMHACYVQV